MRPPPQPSRPLLSQPLPNQPQPGGIVTLSLAQSSGVCASPVFCACPRSLEYSPEPLPPRARVSAPLFPSPASSFFSYPSPLAPPDCHAPIGKSHLPLFDTEPLQFLACPIADFGSSSYSPSVSFFSFRTLRRRRQLNSPTDACLTKCLVILAPSTISPLPPPFLPTAVSSFFCTAATEPTPPTASTPTSRSRFSMSQRTRSPIFRKLA